MISAGDSMFHLFCLNISWRERMLAVCGPAVAFRRRPDEDVARMWRPARISSCRAAAGLAAVAMTAVLALASQAPATGAVGPADWPTFLAGPAHTSDNR